MGDMLSCSASRLRCALPLAALEGLHLRKRALRTLLDLRPLLLWLCSLVGETAWELAACGTLGAEDAQIPHNIAFYFAFGGGRAFAHGARQRRRFLCCV